MGYRPIVFLKQDEALLEFINFLILACNLSVALTSKKVMALHFQMLFDNGSVTNQPLFLNAECLKRQLKGHMFCCQITNEWQGIC